MLPYSYQYGTSGAWHQTGRGTKRAVLDT